MQRPAARPHGPLGALVRAAWQTARVLAGPPPLDELERIADHPGQLRFWALINEGFQAPPVARLGRALFRRLPSSLVYRSWIVPGFVLQILLAAVVQIRRHGHAFRKETGLGLAAQLGALVERCLAHPGVFPEDVYVYDLFRPGREAFLSAGAHNVHVRAVIDLVALRAAPQVDRVSPLLNDKRSFRRICIEEGLPVPELIAAFADGHTEWTGPAHRLPEQDLFVKPARRTLGFGARRVFFDPGRRAWRFEPGRNDPVSRRLPPDPGGPLEEDALLDHLEKTSRTEPFLLQPRIRNHPELTPLVGEATLSTLRVITVRDRVGRCGVVGTFLRTSATDSPIDAFAAGGLSACVDPATGLLGPAYGKVTPQPTPRHPRTGTLFQGFTVPCVAEVTERCLPVVGWDVAIAPEGLLFLEGNSPCDLHFQKLLGTPLWVHQGFARALLSHLDPLRGHRVHLHPAFRERVPPPW